jgi:hypothetical protein
MGDTSKSRVISGADTLDKKAMPVRTAYTYDNFGVQLGQFGQGALEVNRRGCSGTLSLTPLGFGVRGQAPSAVAKRRVNARKARLI